MAPMSLMDRPVELRHDSDGEVADEVSEEHGSDEEQSQTDGSDESDLENQEQSDESSSEQEAALPLQDISFGVLAKAQETFDPNPRKRKLAETLEDSAPTSVAATAEDTFDTRKRAKEARVDAPKRSSKHAPTIESARKPVSRKRTIFEPPAAQKFRDPRFDPTVMSANRDGNATSKANKNYSFLTEYQAAEILDLKSQIKKAKDPHALADLKRQVMSMEAKVRNAHARQKEEEIRKRHKEEEKEAIRTGQKSRPYYLKEADVRRKVKEERLQSMSKGARDKAEKRKQKREKGKEARDMPRVRRER
ncbi:rRNA biogenesis protein rrp36 [Elasticomyces elasticus]|uniref:rRNA biogenesis protein RRP36 n=1 Tax=Exophiala sideris TaxID=1016849 RepID=A0ABR0JKR9_9EURO|nr:rRNA biogenesis protein rrp36 [Elasticomyces elasticus]KAK5032209.1 rRNA biogenesis protein rrp36 [Exophiala sideris]KAK5036207.1 rRNA biogenesis protein rrp36 [Exophiala sideris]KAK5066590.1 rRNA biogenesis protein rrp36 [Exophiala sideris]KAK5180412.1 rRNA biogenesis protein rrp36 [Eurotiomycetes sp. CCFEE 6388]